MTNEKLEKMLDELVRPALKAHGGDVELIGLEDGILRLRMLGQCAGCPAATMTNETIIEGQLMPLIPELKQVILVHHVDESLLDMARSLMKGGRDRSGEE
ncbi:MAG: NifU family protein [Bacillota bacterium]|nr:NifU family protein [Bacillota bacterium]